LAGKHLIAQMDKNITRESELWSERETYKQVVRWREETATARWREESLRSSIVFVLAMAVVLIAMSAQILATWIQKQKAGDDSTHTISSLRPLANALDLRSGC